jgi:hypothetical protein
MKTRIHVNRHRIAANKKNGTNLPTLTVKDYKSNRYGHQVIIHGPSKLVYQPNKPLSCGATAWLECDCDVEIINEPAEVETCLRCAK